jgi:ketosteroid isomerase-like protein
MRKTTILSVCIGIVLLAAQASVSRAQDTAAAIKGTMMRQQEAWNRGDVAAFMSGYKDSDDTTFIGKTVQHGYAMILARYKKAYPTREAMGTLEFSALDVRELGTNYAVVTGRFHLARAAAGGGDASGVFSLVWEKTPQGWKTILDHTSVD